MEKTKYWGLFCILLFCSSSLLAQSSSIYRPDWSVKYNPLAFVTYTPGIELGIESTVTKEASIHIGASYINDFGIPTDQDFSGYKLIGEYRFYSPFTSKSNNTFLAIQFNYKYVQANGRTYLDRANGSYQQLTDITVDNQSLDLMGAIGKVYPIRPWLSIDLSFVVGAKRLKISSDDIPDDAFLSLADNVIFDFSPNEPGVYRYPVFRFQVKFNFEFK